MTRDDGDRDRDIGELGATVEQTVERITRLESAVERRFDKIESQNRTQIDKIDLLLAYHHSEQGARESRDNSWVVRLMPSMMGGVAGAVMAWLAGHFGSTTQPPGH